MSPNSNKRLKTTHPKTATTFKPIPSLQEATDIVQDIFRGSCSSYEIISCSVYRRSHTDIRSNVYDQYQFLCHVNTRICVGYVVCNYVTRGHCDLKCGIRAFNKSSGTSTLKKHAESHFKQDGVIKNIGKLEDAGKKEVRNAAARAVVLDTLPFTFAKKKGMLGFAKTILEVGQSLPPDVEFSIEELISSNVSIKNTITRMAKTYREEFAKSATNLFEIGGAISTDGMTLAVTGDKYYDFNLHFFCLKKSSFATTSSAKLQARLLFLNRHNGSSTASELREVFNGCVKKLVNMTLDDFTKKMTWVTDCARNMAATAGSTTSKRVKLSERWMGCIDHQLNTAMRHSIENNDLELETIRGDINSVKSIVRILKQSGISNRLEVGRRLIQAAETRFGTYLTVAECFISASIDVKAIVDEKGREKAKVLFDSLQRVSTDLSSFSFPSLNAIVNVFHPIRKMQKIMETTSRPIIHHLLPQLESLNTKLRFMSNGIAHGSPPKVADQETRSLAKKALTQVDGIRVHGLWVASCILHPGLRSFSFVGSCANVYDWKVTGNMMIRRMMDLYSDKKADSSCADSQSTQFVTLTNFEFSLKNAMSFLDSEKRSKDELAAYLSEQVSSAMATKLREDDSIVEFWESKWNDYPQLAKVAFRIFSTPPSSSQSERDFSGVNRLVGTDRTLLAEDTISYIACVENALEND